MAIKKKVKSLFPINSGSAPTEALGIDSERLDNLNKMQMASMEPHTQVYDGTGLSYAEYGDANQAAAGNKSIVSPLIGSGSLDRQDQIPTLENSATEDPLSQRPRVVPQRPRVVPQRPRVVPLSPIEGQPGPVTGNPEQGIPGQDIPQPNAPYDARKEYQKAITEQVGKPKLGSRILFQIFQGMTNFANAYQGKEMVPFQGLQEARQQYQVDAANRKFAPLLAIQKQEQDEEQRKREQEMKNQQDALKIQENKLDVLIKAAGLPKAQADAITASIKAAQAKNPEFVNGLMKKGQITKEDAAQAKALGLGELPVFDAREIEREERNGETWERRKGETTWTQSSLPDELSKTPIKRALPDGTEYYTTGDKEADRIFEQEYKQANLDLEAGKFNQNQYDEYITSLQRWNQENAKANSDKAKFLSDAQVKETEASEKTREADQLMERAREIQEEDPQEAIRLKSKAGQLSTEASVAKTMATSLRDQARAIKMSNKPLRPGGVSAPRLGKTTSVEKTITKSEIDALIKSGKMSETQIEALIKKHNYKVLP